MRISDWSTDVCSSDLLCPIGVHLVLVVLVDEPRIIDAANLRLRRRAGHACGVRYLRARKKGGDLVDRLIARRQRLGKGLSAPGEGELIKLVGVRIGQAGHLRIPTGAPRPPTGVDRSEEHTSE